METPEINFNNEHPEMKSNETFIGNMTVYDFSRLTYKLKTARAGHIPYTKSGLVVESMIKIVPVFVDKVEYYNE